MARPDVAREDPRAVAPWSVRRWPRRRAWPCWPTKITRRQTVAFVGEQRRQLDRPVAAVARAARLSRDGEFSARAAGSGRPDCADAWPNGCWPKGIAIRTFDASQHLDERFFRVAVRTAEENERLCDALAEVLESRGAAPGLSSDIVGWVERSETHRNPRDLMVRSLRSTHPTSFSRTTGEGSSGCTAVGCQAEDAGPHAPRHQLQRRQERADGRPVPHPLPGRRPRGPVQVAEHVAQFVRHPRRRRDGPGPGRAGPGLPPGARRADEPHPAEAQLRHRLPGDRRRPAGGQHARGRVRAIQAPGVCRRAASATTRWPPSSTPWCWKGPARPAK